MDTMSRKLAQAPRHKLPTPCGAHILVRALQRHGVELMFGQSLTTVIDAIIDPKAYPPLTLFEGKMNAPASTPRGGLS